MEEERMEELLKMGMREFRSPGTRDRLVLEFAKKKSRAARAAWVSRTFLIPLVVLLVLAFLATGNKNTNKRMENPSFAREEIAIRTFLLEARIERLKSLARSIPNTSSQLMKLMNLERELERVMRKVEREKKRRKQTWILNRKGGYENA